MLTTHDHFFLDSRKFGSSLFHLSAHGYLMFWGGDYDQDIEFFKSRRMVNLGADKILSGSTGRNDSNDVLKPSLKIKIEGGVALQSR